MSEAGSDGDCVAGLQRQLDAALDSNRRLRERNLTLAAKVHRAEEALAAERESVGELLAAVWEAVPRKFWQRSLPAAVRAAAAAGAGDSWREPYLVLLGEVNAAWDVVPDEFVPDDDGDHRLAAAVAAMVEAGFRQSAGDEVRAQCACSTVPCQAGGARPAGADDVWRRQVDRLLIALSETLSDATRLCAEAGEACAPEGFRVRAAAASLSPAEVRCGAGASGAGGGDGLAGVVAAVAGAVPDEFQEGVGLPEAVSAMAAEVGRLREVYGTAVTDAAKYAAAWGALPEPYDAADTLPEAVSAMAADLHELTAEVTELRALSADYSRRRASGGDKVAALRRENAQLRSSLFDAQAGVARLRAERDRLAARAPEAPEGR